MTRLLPALLAALLGLAPVAAPVAAMAAGTDTAADSGTAANAAAKTEQPSDAFEKRRAVAADYVKLYLEHADLPGVSFRVMQPMLQQIAKTQPDLWKEKKAQLTGIAVSSFAKALHDALAGLDVEMAKTFTLKELTALRDFYSSPAGRSVMTKMPGFMRKAVPAAMDKAMGKMAGIRAALEAEGVKN